MHATIHEAVVLQVDRTQVAGIPVTTPARTLIDLAAVASAEKLEEALDDALRRGLVSLPRLRWRFVELQARGRRGVKLFRSLLEARTSRLDVPTNGFERRLLRELKRAQLPLPTIQYQVRDQGRLIARVDFAYPEVKVAIEADGYRWHSGRLQWKRDLARRNALTARGWRVIHVTWDDLMERPAHIVAEVRSSLGG